MQYREGQSREVSMPELQTRCWQCGDSRSHNHLYVNTDTRLYFCHRCGRGGRLSHADYAAVVAGNAPLVSAKKRADWQRFLPNLMPGAATARPSALDRFHLPALGDLDPTDVFLSRDYHGNTIGVCLCAGKLKKLFGKKGIGFAGEEPLVSSWHNPLRLVEGPYDVLSPADVCCFGLIGPSAYAQLAYQWVILCPDGDVWVKPHLRKYLRRMLYDTSRYGKACIVAVERLPDNQDPDNVPIEERERVTVREAIRELER
jgi:hypothetical protein